MESKLGEECSLERKELTSHYSRTYISLDLFVDEPVISVEIHDNLKTILSH